jgi:DNA-binding MarR family transcriptional regulator
LLGGVEYRGLPSVLLLADTAGGLERGRRTAEAACCRVAAMAGVDSAPERLERQAGTDAVLLELDADPGEPLDRLLATLAQAAQARRHASVVIAPRDMEARISSSLQLPRGVRCLYDAGGFERLIAMREAVDRQPPRFEDSKGNGVPTLQELSADVGRIANILASLSQEEQSYRQDEDGAGRVDAAYVRSIIRARRRRDEIFGKKKDLFSDPAWDMLLDLYLSRLERRRVAVSSLCIAASVPSTTALRWIKTMCDHGLFVRSADPEDGRRFFIHLSDDAVKKMDEFFRCAQRAGPPMT